MGHWQTLADALLDEDRILRRRVASLSRDLLTRRGPDDGLSAQEILVHITCWDDYTVRFFTAKLDPREPAPEPPDHFAARSERTLADATTRPFADVLAAYVEATGALVGFISRRWEELSERERRNFWLPLKHRRHHRIALFAALDALAGAPERELAAGT